MIDTRFRLPRLWLGIWLAGWALCIGLSLLPPPDLGAPPQSDKLGHLLAYFTLTTWAMALFPAWRARLCAAAALVGLGIALELAQATLTTTRLGDPRDAVANALGVLAGLAAGATPLPGLLRVVDAWLAARRRGTPLSPPADR
jgi:hypothetical protein